MLVLLPKNEGLQSLQTLSKDLAHWSISSILSSLEDVEILLQIPRFSAEYKTDLRPALEKVHVIIYFIFLLSIIIINGEKIKILLSFFFQLGIKELFGVNANLTGVLSGVSARVGSVLHSAKIEINEAGTIAAAVSGMKNKIKLNK